jgi:prefoldin subunit 5
LLLNFIFINNKNRVFIMATSYTTTIKNLKPQGWSRQTVADGQALNNSFLEPTHQKDLKLAEGLDATNDRIDSVNTQMTTLGQRVSNAESTVANIGEEVQSYSQEIAQLNSNLQIVSAAEGDLATSLGTVTEKLNEHKNLVSVDSTTIAGDGSAESPYTVIGGGGGGGISKVYVPNVDGGNLSYTLSAASAAESQIGPWDIKGPKGENGEKGDDATPLTATTATVAGGTQVTISYTSGGDPLAQFNVLSGASGQNGKDGKDGKDGTNGTSVYLDNVSTVAGGTQVTLGWGTSDTSAFVIPSGAAGVNGISPTVSITDAPTAQHSQGGKTITITDADHPTGQSFDIWNGIDGQGATINLDEGNGIQITHETGTTNYTISVSADYSGAAVASAKNWVNAQGYILSGALNPENSVSGKWRNGQYYDFGLKASAENALAAVNGKLSYVSADANTLSGNGTSGSPLGIDSNNLYELDTAGSYLSSQTVGQKTLISTTPALDNAVQKVIDEADTWDTVSAKSIVTINKATNEIKINNNANSAISATIYDVCNTSELALIPQRLIVGTSSGDFVTYVNGGKCEGQGTLFFWLETMQPWVPVNN